MNRYLIVILSLATTLLVVSSSSAHPWQDDPQGRRGFFSPSLLFGGWIHARNYLGIDAYAMAALSLNASSEVVLTSDRSARPRFLDIGGRLVVGGGAISAFHVSSQVDIGFRFRLVGIGAHASHDVYIVRVPGDRMEILGFQVGPQIYIRRIGEFGGSRGDLVVQWSPRINHASLCSDRNVSFRAIYWPRSMFGVGFRGRWCEQLGDLRDSLEVVLELRAAFSVDWSY